ncbi:aspartyl/asparaginyl beta-hydroxylase domain-containing protein (plasmid) [Streptomyces sp. NBC_01387]|uniref:aspartyl/asparaginyl beta-hydroxylase domain-containing protein n=1 Tax=unclassified Streptomyces TaxID=2593676 RepID=UPI002024D2AA|nr:MULTISPECIES: aspartyl/asparaginyl beta-hydroxylase domain-containing protein [unclassified Streptomyces]MCX4554436.1 aspartyl/asparaginyl beta-hydroxylase domain-containing protein [Streptomyces sp. NBC_01500]WSC25186.1 aspartyl/asparaginyl beta-hydroxylase domain-containing protein [Streptomyces sp. NBC_01766]WSV58938.1 aspartyl/asparaginyl beta-hydroxylase domain-containing protein [Streptomyces sp. NBC_01014]
MVDTRSIPAQAGQIAQLDRLDLLRIERLRHEALTVPAQWTAEYGAYQSGGWWTTSLMNASGNAADVRIGDCTARPTALLESMPATAELLAELGLSYMWVRLARLEANAFLWEHRDYDELDQIERHRLHIPLHTNSSAFLVTGGTKVHMTGGWIWRLTPTYAHGVCNLLGPDRIHLIADVYADDAYRLLAQRAQLNPSAAKPLPAASRALLAAKLADARLLAELGYTGAAEQLLLRLFYCFTLPEGTTYDLIAELHTALGDAEAAARWSRAKTTLLALAES